MAVCRNTDGYIWVLSWKCSEICLRAVDSISIFFSCLEFYLFSSTDFEHDNYYPFAKTF
jgi:hypothetical protein